MIEGPCKTMSFCPWVPIGRKCFRGFDSVTYRFEHADSSYLQILINDQVMHEIVMDESMIQFFESVCKEARARTSRAGSPEVPA